MIDFDSSDKLEIGIGDELDVITAIRRHDIVVFENIAPRKFIIRALGGDEITTYNGVKYKVDKGNKQGSIKLELFGSYTAVYK